MSLNIKYARKAQHKAQNQIEDIVIERLEKESLAKAILFTSNPRDRDFWLLFLDGLSYQQIADRFGVSYSRVQVYAQLALERLECNLIEYGVI